MELQYVTETGGKLLRILRRDMKLSSTLVSRLKFRQALLVNGVPVHTDYVAAPGDTVCVVLDEPTPDYPAEQGPLAIVYEDDSLIALDKPAGLMMHPTFHRVTGTLANRLLAYYQATGQACAVHPVSRLDRDTFGVVLLAKNAHIHALLCQAQKRGELEKTYEAVLFGRLSPERGEINAPIARLSETSLLRCVREDGKPAQTRYETRSAHAQTSLVRLWPLTGRTHQLRVHCAWLGAPVLGDPQYGSPESLALARCCGIASQQLCARSLRLAHPLTGEEIRLESRQTLQFP